MTAMPKHKVKSGDCITSIAQQYGLPWDKLWNHGDNSDLKNQRKDPNALLPGDVVVVPDLTVKEETRGSDSKHKFKVKGKVKLAVRFQTEGQPKKNRAYKLFIDGRQLATGNTDGDGFVRATIPPQAVSGKIILTEEDNTEGTYEFALGTVYPLDTDPGVKSRLLDLGFDVGDDLKEAISAFQSKMKLTVNGTLDAATKDKLKEAFGQ
jgi:hypothetical protein